MTVRINKPALNLREKLAELDKPSGIVGEQILRSDTAEDAREALNLEEHLFEDFESTGIQDNATSTKVTIDDTGVDVTGTVTADGLTVDGDVSTGGLLSAGQTANLDVGAISSAPYPAARISGYRNSGSFASTMNLSTMNGTGSILRRVGIDFNGDVSFYEDTGTTAKMVWDSSAESLGIGTSSPSGLLTLDKDVATLYNATDDSAQRTDTSTLLITNENGTQNTFAQIAFDLAGSNQSIARIVGLNDGTSTSALAFVTEGSNTKREVMRLDGSGNVGIGTSNPSAKLHIAGETRIYPSSGTGVLRFGSGGVEKGKLSVDSLSNMVFETSNSERARIDSSGNLLVGKSSTGFATAGSELRSDGSIWATIDSGVVTFLNRLNTDGAILTFTKDSATVGSISTTGGDLTIGTGDTGVRFDDGTDQIYPVSGTTTRDAAVSLGWSGGRFKDLYLSGDANIEGLLGKSYSQTSTATQTSIIDTGLYAHQIHGAIFDVYFKANANSAGHSSYRSVGHYNVILTTDFNGSSIVHEITQTKLSFAGGGSGDNELTLTAVFWDGTNELSVTGADSNNEIRLKISGYNSAGTAGSNLEVRVTRRI